LFSEFSYLPCSQPSNFISFERVYRKGEGLKQKREERRDGSGFETSGGGCTHPYNVCHAWKYDQKRPF